MMLDLPFFAMIDTSVFLCRVGDKSCDAEAPACIDFCNRMVKGGRRLYVSAPTITEVTRFKGIAVPKVQGITVIAFDTIAATELGMKMPIEALKKWRDEMGREFGHIKYDALIVGCALRVPGCAFVGMDKGQRALASRVGLSAHHPNEFYVEPKPARPTAPLQLPLAGPAVEI